MKPKKLIRVTSVLDFVESKWKEYWWRKVGFEAADKISKDSAEFGTKVHKLIENLLVNKGYLGAESNVLNCASKVTQYLEDNGIKPLFGLPNLFLKSKKHSRLIEEKNYAKANRILKRKKSWKRKV